MTTQKTHWKKLHDYRFLSGEELQGKEITLTIREVKSEEIYSQEAHGKELKHAVWFKETDKGIIVNATNAKAISKELGSPFIEDWIGKQITIYPARIRAFGTETEAIRVKTTQNRNAVKSLNELIPDGTAQ